MISRRYLNVLCTRLDQVERFYAVEKFVQGEKDILVATDIASKGLDFPDVQHVINYDLPEDIENYGKFIELIFLKYFRFFLHRFSPSNRSNRSSRYSRSCNDIYQ